MANGETHSEFRKRIESLTKAACSRLSDDDVNRLARSDNAYPRAMAAMDAAQALPPCTRCEGEYGYADETCCGKPYCFRCLLKHQDSECVA